MYTLKYIIAFHLLIRSFAESESRVSQAFRDSIIVPIVVDESPEDFITVDYPMGSVDLGNELNPLQTLTKPNISYEVETNNLYTFGVFGSNLPLNETPRYQEFLHWLVINIPGENFDAGDTIAHYFPPMPYPGGVIYSFLLFEQNDYKDPEPMRDLDDIFHRPGFDVVKFKRDHDLTGPVAGNFMRQMCLPAVRK